MREPFIIQACCQGSSQDLRRDDFDLDFDLDFEADAVLFLEVEDDFLAEDLRFFEDVPALKSL